MSYMLKKLAGYAAGLALVVSASMIAASPAEAATARCIVPGTGCTTGSIPANSGGHWVYYYWDSGLSAVGCSMRIVDVANGAIVYSGRVGVASHRYGYVYGLYGSYRMEMYNCSTGAVGYIRNTVT
ncbi:hypothetical protein GCM10022252_07770 [Streptosporangium oxazolinicum]|uniref:Uncharacterized protein n=1 Tax=Streptosporangium oxazolinicum TaxID=909287 RepID=A0ABP8ADS7_9ACTN